MDSSGRLTAIRVGSKTIATKRNPVLHISRRLVDTGLISKAIMIYKDHRKGIDFSAGAVVDSAGLTISLPYLGLYELGYDTVAPSISLLSKTMTFSEGDKIKLKIKDNYDVIGLASELKISQWLDQQWVVGNFDLKSNTLRIPIRKSWPKGPHSIKVRAEDDKLNVSETEFKILIQ